MKVTIDIPDDVVAALAEAHGVLEKSVAPEKFVLSAVWEAISLDLRGAEVHKGREELRVLQEETIPARVQAKVDALDAAFPHPLTEVIAEAKA